MNRYYYMDELYPAQELIVEWLYLFYSICMIVALLHKKNCVAKKDTNIFLNEKKSDYSWQLKLNGTNKVSFHIFMLCQYYKHGKGNRNKSKHLVSTTFF